MCYFQPPLNRYEELFSRDCSFVSNNSQSISIKDFIEGLNFEWKISLGSYSLYNQFILEIFDIPNGIIGFPSSDNWNMCTINIDPASLSGNIKTVKREMLNRISHFQNIEKSYANRVIMLTIKFIHYPSPKL